jgi:membrane protease subunit HflK
MPWQNQGGGGGPWGGGGGGGGQGPWGGGRAPQPPNLEDLVRKGQDRLRRSFPGGMGTGRGLLIILILTLIAWLFSGFYRVQPGEQGVVLRFGQWVQTTEPGLHWHIPSPIETVVTPNVEAVNAIDIGFRGLGGGTTDNRGTGKRDIPEESLMLTGDQNIIDIDFTVQWKIADAGAFLFNIREPEQTVKIAAESAMREVIGQTDIQPALTEAREDIQDKTRQLLQATLNDYEAGIEITQLQLREVQPPKEVIDSFDDVQRALQDRDRLRNEADAYRNAIIPQARGEAQKMLQDAQAYKEQLVNEAQGEAQRFLEVYAAYKQNPAVTSRRMYLETLQDVFRDGGAIIMDPSAGQNVIPYLPLPALQRPGSSRSEQGMRQETQQ